MMKTLLPFCLSLCMLASISNSLIRADAPRVLPQNELPRDSRLADLKDLNGYFPFVVPKTKQSWAKRAEEIRRRILVSMGLWPMPARPPVQPTIHGRVAREDYTVDKVYFESYPGFFVTGNLYRPTHKQGPFPVVLSPHGHFNNGRFHDQGIQAVRSEIFVGAERFEVGGRHPLQARCVQLARMGCIVFHYDMVGYADSRQISYELAHRHSAPRPEMENAEQWGFYTAQAEMRLQNIMGLQTFNSLRAVDFVVGLADADTSRIAVTGASGGGTQTMILAALDPRIAVSFPAVMVSTAMQGGCTCENAACLRVDTGNVEFAGLFAPKPQGLNAADDWTVELATKGLPELKQLYELLGAQADVQGYALTHFPHNYNAVSRGKMYQWMNKYLGLGLEEPILERDYQPLTIEEMSVWNDDHPLPPSGDEFEKQWLHELSDASGKQLQRLLPTDEASWKEFRRVVGGAMETILATNWEAPGSVERENISKEDQGNYWLFKDKLRTASTELPVIFLHPKAWQGEVVVWLSGQGKAGVFNEIGKPRQEAMQLLDKGYSIACGDLFQQGEFLPAGDVLDQTRKVGNDRDFAGYTFGYNRTLFGNQVHDILTILKFIIEDEHPTKKIHLLGVDGATPHAVLAKALAGSRVEKLAIDEGDFRFANVKSWRDPQFLPGAVKYGDLPIMIGLCAPGQVWVHADGDLGAAGETLNAAGADLVRRDSTSPLTDAVDWLAD